MKKDFNKIYFTVILIVAALTMIATLAFAFMFNNDAGIDSPENATANTLFNVAYWITVAFIGIAVVLAVAFALIQLVKLFMDNPKKGISTIIPIGVVIVLYIIAYATSSSTDIPQEKLVTSGITAGTSKAIGSGLIMTYILVGLVVIAAIYTEIAKKFK